MIDLSWNKIAELGDGEFSTLLRLQLLNIANNFLEFIPEKAFLKLSTLRTLHLENNKFSRIPSLSFKPLVNLENLYLSFNNLLTPSTDSFVFLPRLQKLSLESANLFEIPTKALLHLSKLESLNLVSNNIRSIPDFSLKNLKKLNTLSLQNNQIETVGSNAFEGLVSLKVLEINGNQLLEIPRGLSSLPQLREFYFSDNKIRFLPKSSFAFNKELTMLKMAGNPIESFDRSTFAQLKHLKKLTLSEVRLLEEFPDIRGTSALEHLRIDRANLNNIPSDLCVIAPLLRSLNLKSNKLTELPILDSCTALRLIDLSYNNIIAIGENAFINQANLIDLFLGHNSISHIFKDSFQGLVNLQVLDMESNEIESIDEEAFVPFKDLRDLNLGANKFPKLPIKGLRNLRELKTFNNRELKEFPTVDAFPKINTLAVSYAYHCCAFMASKNYKTLVPRPSTSLKETIVWLSKEDVDISSWNANITDIWPESAGNFSSKFEEFANQLWKTFGRDYTIPDNLAQYAEEYFEDYKSAFNHEELAKFALQCRPEPGPFMPCEDLFGWWSLRCGVWVVFLLSILGNGTVVTVLLIGRNKMDVPRFLVCNLAGADFFMGIYLGMLAVVDASTLGEFKVSAIKWQTSIGCQAAGFFGVLSSELSVFTLSVITLERNYAITHAMHLNKRLSLRHAGYIMFIGWTFASAMASLPLVGVSDYKKFAICLPFETESVLSLSYVVFILLINGVAFLILLACYLKMYCAIRGSQAWNSNDFRIAKRMSLLVITDFICWSPIAFFSLTAVCGLQLISLEEAKVFAIFVLPFNSCANPFLYAIFTKQFKKDCIHICKRIEESRVTRGIGRGRHSSNFSNRQTPVTTNSAAAAVTPGSDSEPQRCRNLSTDVCRCNKTSWKPKNRSCEGWKEWALKYFLCRGKQAGRDNRDGYTYAIAQIQKNMEKRNKHATSISSENFSSRSDSWRQSNIPLRLMGHDTRRGSWSLQRKASEDSNMSCSRQDSSTSTFHISRSSFSSESSSQPRSSRPLPSSGLSNNKDSFLGSRENKPKLCRQGAVSEERTQAFNVPRHLIQEKTIEGLCPVCAKKEGFKSKELEEKFACFYNRLVESSCGETSDTFSSKEDQVVLSSDSLSVGEKMLVSTNVPKFPTNAQRPHIEVNPMAEKKNSDFSSVIKDLKIQEQDILNFDTKDEGSKKCRSLVNINVKVCNERAKNSSSENSLIKLSLSSQPAILKSFPSHESFSEQRTCLKKKPNKACVLRSFTTENVVQECTGKNTLTEFHDKINRSESVSSDIKCRSLLSTPLTKESHTMKSTSSPNISVKNHETSPLIDNSDEPNYFRAGSRHPRQKKFSTTNQNEVSVPQTTLLLPFV